MAIRTFEWNGDFEACRAEADAGKFDTELANVVGQKMFDDYKTQRQADTPIKMGWSVSTSTTFDMLWTLDARLKPLSEREAKVLFLASSDIFRKLEFGGRTAQEKREDLQSRMSRLCEMTIEMELIGERVIDYDADKYENRWEKVSELEEIYQTLFVETLRIYGN